MENEIIWKGTPSHYVNFDRYLFWTLEWLLTVLLYLKFLPQLQSLNLASELLWTGLAFALLLPLWQILKNYLIIRSTNYQLTSERLITSTGILSRSHDELELYRIKDYQIEEPFFQRLFSLGSIVLETSDKSHPMLSLYAIRHPKGIRDMIRQRVEQLRTDKGVREIDH